MPWPRIFSEPKRAISPMTSPPSAGVSTVQMPGTAVAGDRLAKEKRPNQARLVVKRDQFHQYPGRAGAGGSDDYRHADENQHAPVGAKVAES